MKALKANVEIQKADVGGEDYVAFIVSSPDGSKLTGNQILEAVAEAIVLCWDHNPMEERHMEEFDA